MISQSIAPIQYLRAIAAAMVVIFHASREIRATIGHSTLAWGEFGVDVFFVISGFIMAYSIDGRTGISLRTFIFNRLTRIAPLYWLLTLLIFIGAWIAPSLFKTVTADADHLVASILFIPKFHPNIPTEVLPTLIPGWTINYEMFFYVSLSLFLWTPASFRLGTTILFITATYFAATFVDPQSSAIAKFLSNSIVFEFVFGILIYIAYKRKLTISRRLNQIGLILGAASIFLFSDVSHRLMTAGLSSAVIVYTALSLGQFQFHPLHRLLHTLGDASYSLYLTHIFFLGIAALVLKRITGNGLITDVGIAVAYVICSTIISQGIAVACYHFIESPLLRRFRSILGLT